MKLVRWVQGNILFVFTLFFLAFIPLYPKLPLLDIRNTWVYVRIEDFLVIFVFMLWTLLLIRKKITLRTPLTMPILIFWIVGAIATIHGVLLIFPTIAGVFPNVAFLSLLRRIEYISLFFIAYSGMKDKRFLTYTVAVLVITLLIVVFYGVGQRYLGFPAFLTMNEEFAKGEAIRLSALSRVPSTFAGHYDLAAYLVLILPILTSMLFGFRNLLVRATLFVSVILGFILLFMTVSRVSVVVVLISLVLVLFFQRKKKALLSLIVLGFFGVLFVISFTPALLQRFGDTVKEVDVIVDASTGQVIGHTSLVPGSQFDEKLLVRRVFQDPSQIPYQAVFTQTELEKSLPTAYFDHEDVPEQAAIVLPANAPTGENLPQGTSYINLSLSPVIKKLNYFFYEDPSKTTASTSAVSYVFQGNFLIKRASAYDLSFTTRFQGEWPNAITAFKRNILLGSGYSSLGLAVDNNYLRMLGEIGIVGFVAFMTIFIVVGIYIQKILPDVDSKLARSFIFGFLAGVIGLMLNATLIDVFEASKVAFVLWLLTGVTVGTLSLYQSKQISIPKELRRVVSSNIAIIIYLLLGTVIIFAPLISNYFVADDYIWLRWAANCGTNLLPGAECPSFLSTIIHYFTQSDGFFYRPGTKTYFFLMYAVFWLNQTVYHLASLLLHFLVAVLFFFLAKKILHSTFLAAVASIFFLLMSGYAEIVFWISATGHLFNAFFILLSLLLFIRWEEKKRAVYFVASFLSLALSLLFYEVGVIVPLLILLYKFTQDESFSLRKILKTPQFLLLFVPIVVYGIARYAAHSHWSGGDYSYNLLKLPFNFVGNLFGYILLTYFGPISLPAYQLLRNLTRENIVIALIALFVVLAFSLFAYKKVFIKIDKNDRRTVLFCVFFFVIALLPFLGFGNIASRYSYLACMGLIMLLVFVLRKLYTALLSNGRDIALSSITTIFLIFCLLHIIQVQQIRSDWYEAGGKAQRFFIAIDGLYEDYWSKDAVKFYFINVPIRVGQAWVFPVGLTDGLWFVFRNPKMQIYTLQSDDERIKTLKSSYYEKVFEFDESGQVKERYNLPDKK